MSMNTQLGFLDELPDLKPFPTVASRLLQVTGDDHSHVTDLATIIATDPAITSQLMRLANSSAFGFVGQIRSVNHAVVVLGRRQIRNLAVALAAGQLFQEGPTAHDARRALWEHALGCAALARVLASFARQTLPDEAFLAGILHDVGKLVFLDAVADQYVEATREADSSQIVDIEHHVFGTTHQELGQRCADEWGLPWELNEAIRFHHVSTNEDFGSEISAVIAAANVLSKVWRLVQSARDSR